MKCEIDFGNDEEEILLPKMFDNECDDVILEEDLLDEYEYKWSYEIQKRGEDYYFENHVLKVYKNNNKYYAKVSGNKDEPYDVSIEVMEDDLIMECTCPCTYPCKHEYAALMAICDHEYEKVTLQKPIKELDIDLIELIKNIPAEELKGYLLSPLGKDKFAFEINSLHKYFKKYLPNQEYEYYYNNLYNSLVLNNNYQKLIKEYLNTIKQYISSNEFKEVFKINYAIINAYKDTNRINFDDYFTDILPSIGMYLRVIYRKCDDDLKDEINNWVKDLERENYYNSYYLEDIVLSMNITRE